MSLYGVQGGEWPQPGAPLLVTIDAPNPTTRGLIRGVLGLPAIIYGEALILALLIRKGGYVNWRGRSC